eukprot:981096-Amphidinium_carterae.1
MGQPVQAASAAMDTERCLATGWLAVESVWPRLLTWWSAQKKRCVQLPLSPTAPSVAQLTAIACRT